MNATSQPRRPLKRGDGGVKKSRIRAMTWSLLFILAAALLLPAASYLLPQGLPAVAGEAAHAQVTGDANQRANFWRAVREGEAGYSAVAGAESGVFINNGGQNWRQVRNGLIATYGGWAILAALAFIAVFYVARGRIKIEGERGGRTVPRWQLWERVMHWYTAVLFVILAVTGLSMLFGRILLIPVLGAPGFAAWANLSINAHNILGPFFSLGVLAMLIFWTRNNIPSAVDWAWFKAGGGIVGKAHPSAGKANGGEKIWFWLVIFVGLLAVCGSGLALIGWFADIGLGDTTRASMQFMHQIHAVSALLWIVVFFGHVYIGTIGTEGALEGMTTGRVSEEWAKQHHDLWYDEVKSRAAKADAGDSGDSLGDKAAAAAEAVAGKAAPAKAAT